MSGSESSNALLAKKISPEGRIDLEGGLWTTCSGSLTTAALTTWGSHGGSAIACLDPVALMTLVPEENKKY